MLVSNLSILVIWLFPFPTLKNCLEFPGSRKESFHSQEFPRFCHFFLFWVYFLGLFPGMLKETEMKLLVWELYNPPLPPQASLNTPDTQLDERAWCEEKDRKTFFSFILALSHSPPSPPASNPTRELFLKKCDLPCLKNLRSKGNNQQPNSNSTYIWWPRLRDSNGAILVEGECSHPLRHPCFPKVSTKMKQSLAKERYAHLLRERNSTDRLEGLFVSYEIFES